MVHDYVEKNFKVWSIGADEQLLPTLLPWLDQQMEDATYARDASEEGFVLYLCLPTCGVVSASKANFFDFPDLLSDGPAIEFDRHHHPTKQSRREREKDKFWTAAWLTEAFFSETQQDFATNCS